MIKMTGDKQIKAFDILADRTASRAIQLQSQRKMSLDDGQFTPYLPKEKKIEKARANYEEKKDSDENDT